MIIPRNSIFLGDQSDGLKYLRLYRTLARVAKISDNMNSLSVKITEEQLIGLDELLRHRHFPTRSEAIRAAIRDLIQKHQGKY